MILKRSPVRIQAAKERNMFKVTIANTTQSFATMDDARAFAQKESYIQAVEAVIKTPAGQTIRVKV